MSVLKRRLPTTGATTSDSEPVRRLIAGRLPGAPGTARGHWLQQRSSPDRACGQWSRGERLLGHRRARSPLRLGTQHLGEPACAGEGERPMARIVRFVGTELLLERGAEGGDGRRRSGWFLRGPSLTEGQRAGGCAGRTDRTQEWQIPPFVPLIGPL